MLGTLISHPRSYKVRKGNMGIVYIASLGWQWLLIQSSHCQPCHNLIQLIGLQFTLGCLEQQLLDMSHCCHILAKPATVIASSLLGLFRGQQKIQMVVTLHLIHMEHIVELPRLMCKHGIATCIMYDIMQWVGSCVPRSPIVQCKCNCCSILLLPGI